ncbi:hypothetical protein [Cytobacillus sp. NCCP-133]|uniref:hypothetical protein n=1 Tax=Cytobacillus sp. NCCP-133 TaxID=766848 RepID=UPI00222E901F|nr:hypothetical protein [Cytobacillus sp. NCCP-133]GLB58656.1 hypothetical protein NCCP133_07890 [Cytobacillus sp. NCCP-133]
MEEIKLTFGVSVFDKWTTTTVLLEEGYSLEEIDRAIAVVLNNKSQFAHMNYYYGFEACVRSVLERG